MEEESRSCRFQSIQAPNHQHPLMGTKFFKYQKINSLTQIEVSTQPVIEMIVVQVIEKISNAVGITRNLVTIVVIIK